MELLPIVAIAVIFWFLIIRPASRQRKAAAELQAALGVGDDVMLTSGILGTIVDTDDEHVHLEIAPGVVVRVVRGAIASVRRDEVDGTDDQAETDETGEPQPEDLGTTDIQNEER